MSGVERILAQRSHGSIDLRIEHQGLARMREEGAAKVRFPHGGQEAILINTGGGLAGGDAFHFAVAAGENVRLTITTQAPERVYRTLGPPAVVAAALQAGTNARLLWLPQETIVFDGAALSRRIDADLAPRASLLAVESIVFGRKAMGEAVRSAALRDRWRIRRAGKLVFAEELAIDGRLPGTKATLAGACAMATVVFVSGDAESRREEIRGLLGHHGGVSAWDGKLVARVLASDDFELRKMLIPALIALGGREALPKVWAF